MTWDNVIGEPSFWALRARKPHTIFHTMSGVLDPGRGYLSRRGGLREHDPTWLPSLASCITRICGSCAAITTGIDVRTGGWDIRGRWFGAVVAATPRLGELRRGETIPWRVIAAQFAPRERRGSH